MCSDRLNDLLSQLGTSLGLPNLAPDAQGYCCLQIGGITLSIQYEATRQDLVIFSRLCQIDDSAAADAYPLLLAANLLWLETQGATLALDPHDASVFLQIREKIEPLDFPSFLSMLKNFVEVGETWQKRLERFSDDIANTWPSAPADVLSGHIRVR
jgi:hypothetical protein